MCFPVSRAVFMQERFLGNSAAAFQSYFSAKVYTIRIEKEIGRIKLHASALEFNKLLKYLWPCCPGPLCCSLAGLMVYTDQMFK
jgi:hypothetical protein